MKKIIYLFVFIYAMFFMNSNAQNKGTLKAQSKDISEFNSFLSEFTLLKELPDSIQTIWPGLKDTINVKWSDEILFGYNYETKKSNGMEYKFAKSVCDSSFESEISVGGGHVKPSILHYSDERIDTIYHPFYKIGKVYLKNGDIGIICKAPNTETSFYYLYILDTLGRAKTGIMLYGYYIDGEHQKDTITYTYVKSKINKDFSVELTWYGAYNTTSIDRKYILNDAGLFECVFEKVLMEDNRVILTSKRGYFVSDPDGYTNLRNKPSIESSIVKKLKNGTKLEILDASKNWWRIRTKDKNKDEGFIHKSRILEGKQ